MEERIDIEVWDRGLWAFLGPGIHPDVVTDIRSMTLTPLPEGVSHPWGDPATGCLTFMQRYDESWWMLPRGLKDSLLDRLRQRGLGVRWHPDSRWPEHYDPTGWSEIEAKLLNDSQRWAAQGMWQARDGIAHLPTRFGKSYCTAASWVGAGRPRAIIVVPRSAIARQLRDELTEFLGEQVGIVCNTIAEPDIQRLTVVSLKSVMTSDPWTGFPVAKPEFVHWLWGIEAVYVDEAHIAGDQMFGLHLATQNRIYQWAVTATPFVNDDLKDSSLVAFTGPIRLQMKARQAADLGLIAQLQVRWYDIYYPPTLNKASHAAEYYSEAVVENDFRNGMIAWIADHHLKHGDRVIIFVDRIAHGKKLAEMIPGAVANVGRVSEKQKQKFQDDFNSGELTCVVVTKRWREGVTVAADVAINAEGLKSDHVQVQKMGRGLLPKDDGRPLLFYDFNDHDDATLERWASYRAKAFASEHWPQETCGKIDCDVPIF